jgi:hypothetical protein
MDISVVPSVEPAAISEGLCGNANGNPMDDYIPRGSTTPDYSYEPIQLAASYM